MVRDHRAAHDVAYLKRQAERCWHLAATMTDRRTSALLESMAGEFEALAEHVAAGRLPVPDYE
ncbi:MAG TPA: hypothetical protein VE397_04740 [Stellaceae bacterium]|jgi:hypothetical protein|nr:hypothetical protein [Stellaceae bacterium]